MISNWSYPTEIKFGCGTLAALPEACKSLGIKKPLFITDRTLVKLGSIDKAFDLLNTSGIKHGLFNGVDSNPNEKNVFKALDFFKTDEYDGVIAFGGGSVLDIGKIVALMIGQTRPIWDFEDIGDNWKRANTVSILPVIAIPTTAGTGSEVGRASVITNSQTFEKKIIFHPKILPAMVICDPDLTVGMPKELTAGTGLDAFAHCVEAFSSPHFHPMSQAIALEGMRLVIENLPRAYAMGSDIEARGNMMCAAMMGAT
ncbi:MAG: alcohol dehydrogenase, partial [Rhodobacteraceae bacterium]|nr:alcohol dehydrogenase [Paracoccaceae bacterium]